MGIEKATEMAREPERVITLNEASRILSVSYNTTLRLVQSGELKAFRIRNAWRTSTTACENYIRNQFLIQASECRSEKKVG